MLQKQQFSMIDHMHGTPKPYIQPLLPFHPTVLAKLSMYVTVLYEHRKYRAVQPIGTQAQYYPPLVNK